MSASGERRFGRRGLLVAGAGLVAGAAVGGGATLAGGAAPSAEVQLRRSAWSALRGRTIRVEGGRRARILGVEDLGRPGTRLRAATTGREDAFVLRLALDRPAPTDEPVVLHHPKLGAVPLLLTHGRGRGHVATIDRRTAA